MKIKVINGPNLNMLGIRERQIYGNETYEDLLKYIEDESKKRNIEVSFYQSNHEGAIVDEIQNAYFDKYDGIVINPGAYTHTSIAIADAIKAIAPLPVVEVHISDIDNRDEFRKHSFSAPYCIAQIKGLGFEGYVKAIDTIISYLERSSS